MPMLQLTICPALDDRGGPMSTPTSSPSQDRVEAWVADLCGLPPMQVLTVAGDPAGLEAFRLATRLQKPGMQTNTQLLMALPEGRAAGWESRRERLLDEWAQALHRIVVSLPPATASGPSVGSRRLQSARIK